MPGLICRVGKGAMTHERALFFEGVEGEHETWADPQDVTVVDDEGLEEDRAEGVVRIQVIERDEERGRVLVQLPCEVIRGSRRVWVAISNLRIE